jgi:hypothetical protein
MLLLGLPSARLLENVAIYGRFGLEARVATAPQFCGLDIANAVRWGAPTDAAAKAVPCARQENQPPNLLANYLSVEQQCEPKQVLATATISVLSAEMVSP